MTEADAVDLMQRHAAAWNAHDIDALLALLTQDCVYEAAAGRSAYGERYTGHAALRAAFCAIWTNTPDARWDDPVHTACGDQGFSLWTFRGTGRDGRRIEARGVDLLHFRDGRICRKDTFRKNVVAP